MVQVKISKRFCKGCELCVAFCPAEVLEMSSRLGPSGVPYAVARADRECTGCRNCAAMCPDAAIEIYQVLVST